MESFRDLDVWQKAMTLAETVYAVSRAFPRSELFCVTAQMRRAVLSIPANLAEGHARPRRAFQNHVSSAIGSQAELDTFIELSRRFGWLSEDVAGRLQRLSDEVGKMLYGLIRALER